MIIQDIRMVTRHIYTIAYHWKKNNETPVKLLILKQIYTETSEPSLEALLFHIGGAPQIQPKIILNYNVISSRILSKLFSPSN